MVKPRSKIIWKDTAVLPEPDLPVYIEEPESSLALHAAWSDYMTIGHLWRLVKPMSKRIGNTAESEYLRRDSKIAALFPKGTLAIYAGSDRRNERDPKRDNLRVVRHTFIIQGGKYIVTDFNNVEPVV